jgi:hypothetical protein
MNADELHPLIIMNQTILVGGVGDGWGTVIYMIYMG